MVRDRQARGEITALVVDEAQALPDELLEEIRLLANMETPTGKLLPVVLAGQPELAERLNEPRLRQLKQRIALRCELKPLSLPDTAAYIASRIRTAGGDPGEHLHARGRDADSRVLARPAADDQRDVRQRADVRVRARPAPVDGDIVREVCRDFDLRPAAGKLQTAPTPLVLVEPVAPPPATAESAEPAADNSTGQKKQATGRKFSLLGLR